MSEINITVTVVFYKNVDNTKTIESHCLDKVAYKNQQAGQNIWRYTVPTAKLIFRIGQG